MYHIENTKTYTGFDLYSILHTKFECDYDKFINGNRIEEFGFKLCSYNFTFDGTDYFKFIYDILNKQLDDISNVTGKDLERAELDFLIYSIKFEVGDNKMFFIDEKDCRVELSYDPVTNVNRFYIRIYIK